MRIGSVETLSVREVRRLALARAGLLKPEWTGMPRRAPRGKTRAREAAHRVIHRFGYLQLDTVSIAGARSHAIVLLSRLAGLDPELPEELLRPGAPLFEYWGHEASLMPMALYPLFEFRRRAFRRHPWWGDIVGAHRDVASGLLRRIREQGPIRSVEMEGRGSRGWWDLKVTKQVAAALWSSGELAIRERRAFQRSFDLAERVIPDAVRGMAVGEDAAYGKLVLRALRGHGWAMTGTLERTWRLRNRRPRIVAALARLREEGRVVACALDDGAGGTKAGFIRPADLELAARLADARPRVDRGVLLSPFDPVLWDRPRVAGLFGFEQLLEIFKPAARRRYGYYCMPVLAGDRLVARVDLKADRKRGKLGLLSLRFERGDGRGTVADRSAVASAIDRYATALELMAEPAVRP